MWNKFLHNPLHIVKDYELRKLLWQSGGGTAVCKKYLKFRDTAPEKLTFPETQVDEPIWLFWNTGLDKAPEIVRTCYQSVKKYAGRQVVLLTENNVQNYINMPDYLNEKYGAGTVEITLKDSYYNMKEKIEVPIWQKLLLTIEETSAYSNIGRDKITEMTNFDTCDFVIYKGTHKLINRKKFEDYINNIKVL